MPDAMVPNYGAALDAATDRAFRRYSGTQMVFHWLTATLMFAILPVGWVMLSIPRGDPAREFWFMIHKSIGMTILAVVVLRIIWRMRVAPPPFHGRLEPWEAWGARISHVLLYAILIVMPVSGYILSAAGGYPPTWFDLFTFPGIPESKSVAHAAAVVHLATQWLVYALIILHLLGTTWHVAVRRDGTLARMLPPQTGG